MGQILIVGQGVEAWLTACVAARFIAPKPSDVTVMLSDFEGSGQQITIRPDMMRFHRAIGLDVSKVEGARQSDIWTGPNGQEIPFTPYGKPLGAVALHHILTRLGQGDSLKQYNAAFLSSAPTSEAWLVPAENYAGALKSIAKRAGVKLSSTCEGDFIINFEPHNHASVWCDGVLSLNTDGVCESLPQALKLHTLYVSLMSLVSGWAGDDWLPVERRALDRRIKALQPCLTEMSGLLNDDFAVHSRLAHRIDMWRSCGRLVPVDDDPFSASEWIAALMSCAGAPQGYDRLADTFTQQDMMRHLADCRPKEAVNV